MCIFAASIDQMKRYIENPCTGYCTGLGPVPVPISPCSHYSKCSAFNLKLSLIYVQYIKQTIDAFSVGW